MIVPVASTRAEQLLAAQRVLVVAHRGNSSVAPENTLPAFHSATALGVDMVEFDYHHSADGVPVVIHDPTLERTTDAAKRWGSATLPVAERTMAELAVLDAGSWFSPQFAETRLSPVVDAVDAIHAGGCVAVIERKSGDAATLIAALATRGRLGDAVVQAFDWAFLAECRRLEPRLVFGALGRHEITPANLAEVAALGAKFIGWADADLHGENIALAHRHGLKVFDFTVDDDARAVELIAAGLDGIITNVPERMQKIGGEHTGVAA
jgi:glycerophosphoryl diester phosphodiesterase